MHVSIVGSRSVSSLVMAGHQQTQQRFEPVQDRIDDLPEFRLVQHLDLHQLTHSKPWNGTTQTRTLGQMPGLSAMLPEPETGLNRVGAHLFNIDIVDILHCFILCAHLSRRVHGNFETRELGPVHQIGLGQVRAVDVPHVHDKVAPGATCHAIASLQSTHLCCSWSIT